MRRRDQQRALLSKKGGDASQHALAMAQAELAEARQALAAASAAEGELRGAKNRIREVWRGDGLLKAQLSG